MMSDMAGSLCVVLVSTIANARWLGSVLREGVTSDILLQNKSAGDFQHLSHDDNHNQRIMLP